MIEGGQGHTPEELRSNVTVFGALALLAFGFMTGVIATVLWVKGLL